MMEIVKQYSLHVFVVDNTFTNTSPCR